MAVPKHALVPIVGADGDIRWQDWTYGELIQHLNNDLQVDPSTLDFTALRTAPGTWILPTLVNAWANVGGVYETAGYLKDALGWVHIRGVIAGGANNTTAFTLPPGYRPGAKTLYSAGQGGATTWAIALVDVAGVVTIQWLTANTLIGLSGINFLAEN